MATFDVLLPVHDAVEFLAESIDSVVEQTFGDWRLLVLDHGSTDGSRELAESYRERDPRIEVLGFPEAKGLADLLNRGLDRADCRYVLRHDADDICYPGRMQIVHDAFEAMPRCTAIGGQVDVIDRQGAPIGAMNLPVGPRRVAASSFFRNPVAHPASALRLAALNGAGIRYGVDFLGALPPGEGLEVNALAEDYLLFGQLAQLGTCTNLPDKLIKYRWHGGNVGATKYRDQMLVSLAISRFLADSFSVRRSLPRFDPAPFCNFGDALMEIDGSVDFSAEFERMAAILREGLGASEDVEREIAFRRVVSTRRSARLLWRYLRFSRDHAPDSGEKSAVRSWVTRRLSRTGRINVAQIAY